MKRKQQNGLVPIGEVLADLDGPVQADVLRRAGAVSCNHPEQLVDELNLLPNI